MSRRFHCRFTLATTPFPRAERLRYSARRDASGRLGLLAEQCPHRRASLVLGCTERNGLRCGYHGWLFVWPDVWRDIAHAELPCNFVQIMENSVDPCHVEWLHGRYGSFLKELAGWLRDYVDGQDICAWVTQGAIADRSREHLGRSDLGVIMLRKLYFEQMSSIRSSPIRDQVVSQFGDQPRAAVLG